MNDSKRPSSPPSNAPDAELLERAFDEAMALARRAAAEDEVPVGAVVCDRNGAIIGRGYNRREQEQTPLGHAELMAIAEASRAIGSWRLLDCWLAVTLEPCPMCLAACQQARLSTVFYGTTDPKGGALSLGYRLHEDVRLNHRFAAELHERQDCREVLREFFKEKRSK